MVVNRGRHLFIHFYLLVLTLWKLSDTLMYYSQSSISVSFQYLGGKNSNFPKGDLTDSRFTIPHNYRLKNASMPFYILITADGTYTLCNSNNDTWQWGVAQSETSIDIQSIIFISDKVCRYITYFKYQHNVEGSFGIYKEHTKTEFQFQGKLSIYCVADSLKS